MQLRSWAKREAAGVATSSYTGFYLSKRRPMSRPDAAWTAHKRLDAWPAEDLEHFLPNRGPDFAIDCDPALMVCVHCKPKWRSTSQRRQAAWLLDPSSRIALRVSFRRPVQVVQAAVTLIARLSCGLVLDLVPIWS